MKPGTEDKRNQGEDAPADRGSNGTKEGCIPFATLDRFLIRKAKERRARNPLPKLCRYCEAPYHFPKPVNGCNGYATR